jgi:hypothetical protein
LDDKDRRILGLMASLEEERDRRKKTNLEIFRIQGA